MENPRLPATGRSPRARERAKGARPTPGSYNTLCKTRMRFATETFFGSFFQKGTKGLTHSYNGLVKPIRVKQKTLHFSHCVYEV